MAFFINQKKELKKILLSRVFLGYSILMLVFLIYLVLPSSKIPQLEKKHPYERGFISDLMGEPTDNYLTN